jgi:hypothetical protein
MRVQQPVGAIFPTDQCRGKGPKMGRNTNPPQKKVNNVSDVTCNDSPSSLVAIIVAARRARDKELERAAKTELETRFGVRLSFVRPSQEGGRDAS